MLARLLDRLTYANVVATLALFIALGGSAYAVGEINSRDVKNRSLKGGDLRLNTVTGKEINESKVGTVPAARQAETAGIADISKSANSATTAGTADVANLARDAQTLAGQGAGAFESSSVVSFNRASLNPANAAAEQTVLSWPELGAEIRSSSVACGGNDLPLRVRNTKSAGAAIEVYEGGDLQATLFPGQDLNFCSNQGANGEPNAWRGTLADSTGRTLYFDCVGAVNELRCLGVRSEA
jgi:hypothetical protein